MTVRDALREATSAAHARLDAVAEGLDLSDSTVYGRFLMAQAGPVFALEEALEAAGVAEAVHDWPRRSRRTALHHDLDALGLHVPAASARVSEVFGALYVLEGSRLGAAALSRRVSGLPDHFLRHGEGERLWPSFLELLEKNISAATLPACIQNANGAFDLFEGSLTRVLGA